MVMAQFELFSTQSSQGGYKLHSVEIYNWGVFDGKVFRISPQGNTTLLTGANGAGKTTYLEAILTLLVPERRMRRYNQAAGAVSKKDERSEESYVLGEIGEVETEEQGKETVRLRPDKSKVYSVLLATFRDGDKFVTLAQVRWFAGSEMRRTYLVAREALTIEKDFYPFDVAGVWKKKLKQRYPKVGSREVIEDFDSPGKYASAIRRHFGMRSEKALALFSQTVGLKVLGNLNEFIRNNMLEESNIEDDFFKLKSGFQTLLNAHNAIVKAEAQLKLLYPVVEKEKELKKTEGKYEELDGFRQTAVPYFAFHKKRLLGEEIERLRLEMENSLSEQSALEREMDLKQEEANELDSNIRNDEVGKRIQDIVKEINRFAAEKEKRSDKLRRYNQLAVKVGLRESPTEKQFAEQLSQIRKKEIELGEEADRSYRNAIKEEGKRDELKRDWDEKSLELETLLGQKNNITGRVGEIRQEILAFTGASEQEIPFIGELLQVRPEARNEWEVAIEKVLHHFALQLVVPEQYYKEVNQYVNSHNLKGRIIYQQVKNESYMNDMIADVRDSLFSKIEINRKSEYAEWIEHQIRTRFDFICTNNMDSFRLAKRAVTAAGLIKNDRRHEKDDRSETFRRENFVLGWDNKEKIKLTRQQLKEIDAQIKEAEKQISLYQRQKERCDKEQKCHITLSGYEKFEELNWKEVAVKMEALEQQRRELEKANDRVKVLKQQLDALKKVLKELDVKRLEYVSKVTTIKSKQENYQLAILECEDVLERIIIDDLAERFSLLSEAYPAFTQELRFQNVDRLRNELMGSLNKELTDNAARLNKAKMELQLLMAAFKTPSEELRLLHPDWMNDTYKLSANIEYVGEYIDLYRRIGKEQLVEYKKQFKKYLNDDMITRMTGFQANLESQEENIRENIRFLNQSLEGINFRPNPETFIELDIKEDNADRIRRFKLMLRGWKPNWGEYEATKNDELLENSFRKIKELIDYLSDNAEERKYVTDVRNWLLFNARELHREDRSIHKIYENTGKLSGGEKAQLTYTILGSAIAYQFGISQEGTGDNSFRFICIDESFSNQDTEKANYLMELCRQLHLQLLCVTPEDKTNVVESYISAVHFVKRENNKNAVIYDLPIAQYVEEREKYINGGDIGGQ